MHIRDEFESLAARECKLTPCLWRCCLCIAGGAGGAAPQDNGGGRDREGGGREGGIRGRDEEVLGVEDAGQDAGDEEAVEYRAEQPGWWHDPGPNSKHDWIFAFRAT